jgi:2-hydroxy-3-oxopropionate reductase
MKIGFIGLGTMGRPMAGHLQAGQHKLFLHDVAPLPQELIEGGGVACKSGKQVAQESEVIIVMVPDTPHVEAVLFGADGVAAGLSKGKIVVDMSSISPLATKEFAKKIEALGCDYLDAPVSGGEVGAKAASLTIMVGGPERAFNTMRPVFDKMGKNVTHVGANGDGQTTKVANQIIVALTIQAVGEALLFASRAGADPALVRQALMGGFASSRILEVHGERMSEAQFCAGLPHRAAPEGSQSCTGRRACAGIVVAEHGSGAADVLFLRRPWRQGLGSFRAGARARDDGEPRDREGVSSPCGRGNLVFAPHSPAGLGPRGDFSGTVAFVAGFRIEGTGTSCPSSG